MNKSLSVYLDLCRFLAAVTVVLAHLIHFDVAKGDWANWLPHNGHDAVILFFVLSGFVIYYTTQRRHTDLADYTIARATRIYSVALPILLLTVAVDLIGLQFHPENYTGLYQYQKLHIYVPFHLAFLGEIWTISEQPFTVPPYWSLGYEVWYYALFAAFFFYRDLRRVVVFGLLLLFVGYKLWLLFPIWLAGVGLYKLGQRFKPEAWLANLLFYLPIPLYIAYKHSGLDLQLIALGEQLWPFPSLALGSAAKYLNDYLVCLLVVSHLFGAHFVRLDWVLRWQKPIVWLASYTFTLYLLHAPVIKTVHHNFAIDPYSPWTSAGLLVLVALLTYGLGSLTEQRKAWFTPGVSRIVRAIAKGLAALPGYSRWLAPNRPKPDLNS